MALGGNVGRGWSESRRTLLGTAGGVRVVRVGFGFGRKVGFEVQVGVTIKLGFVLRDVGEDVQLRDGVQGGREGRQG